MKSKKEILEEFEGMAFYRLPHGMQMAYGVREEKEAIYIAEEIDIKSFLTQALQDYGAYLIEQLPEEPEVTEMEASGYHTAITENGKRLSPNQNKGYNQCLSDSREALLKANSGV